jgi:WhiB family redox-sensing transcriptional regulator
VVKTREWDPDDAFTFLLELLHPEWHKDAACRGMDPAIFYPENNYTSYRGQVICEGCPVRNLCDEAGEKESHGIWGGVLPAERRDAKRRKRLVLA